MRQSSRYQQLAEDTRVTGWTREQVIATLRMRIDRDDRYLARRQRQQLQTRFDEQVTNDLYAFALAIALLEHTPPSSTQGSKPDANHP